MSDRYDGKPFLRMLDGYILDAIGQLPAGEAATLDGMQADWRAFVSREMRFPYGMADAVREVWEKGQARFREANGQDPDPAEFARTFVDRNFPH